MFALLKMLHDTSEGFCIQGCIFTPHKHFEQGVPPKKANPRLSASWLHHCFSVLAKYCNGCVTICITALRHAKKLPTAFLAGVLRDKTHQVPNPVHCAGGVKEAGSRQQRERGPASVGGTASFAVVIELLHMAPV